MQRWEEEVTLLIEEMRRVVEYGKWKAKWWGELTDSIPGSEPLREGVCAYALEHKDRELVRAEALSLKWGKLCTHAKAVLEKLSAGILDVELEEEENIQPD